MEVTVRQANEGDITSIHSLLEELERPKASDNNEVKIFQKRLRITLEIQTNQLV